MNYETWNRQGLRTITARFVNREWPEGIIGVELYGIPYSTTLADVEECARQAMWEQYGKTGGHMCFLNIHKPYSVRMTRPDILFATGLDTPNPIR